MAVSLPTAADVRKVRENARKTVVERTEFARTPLLAVVGAGDLAVTTVAKAVADARTRAANQAEDVQSTVAELPSKLTVEELRKAIEEFRAQAEKVYGEFAERGQKAIGRFRAQPQVKQAIDAIETYTDKLDARVDAVIDDTHDAAEKALSTVSTQTRSTGEKVAQTAQRVTGKAAGNISAATKEASEAVAKAGSDLADEVGEAGDTVARETRSTTRRVANKTAPKAAAPKAPAKTNARKVVDGK